MTARVSEEAAAFLKVAPEILGTETLNHSEIKPPSRFHPRVGAGATAPPEVQWIQRQIVSEYGFSSFATANGASPAVHELRQITSVDGKKIKDQKKAQDTLAAAITASADAQKRALLKEFEKIGLAAARHRFRPDSVAVLAPRSGALRIHTAPGDDDRLRSCAGVGLQTA